jgi:hypothetical protein
MRSGFSTWRAARAFGVAALFLGASAGRLDAASHLWKISEVFSNADGSIQFVELHECCGAAAENFIRNLEFTSEATGSVFKFPSDLTGSTSRRYLLLATQSFADQPGAPAPDYIIPPNFVAITGDKLWYSEARNYDSFTFGAEALPLDGINSIQVTDYGRDLFETKPNNPTNYSGVAGLVTIPPISFTRGDCNADGASDVSDAVHLLDSLFRDAAPQPPCIDACDANDDRTVDLSDGVRVLLALFSEVGPLPAPTSCAPDPTPDTLGCEAFAACP